MWTCTSYFLASSGIVCAGTFDTQRAIVALLRVYGDSPRISELFIWPDRVM